MFHIFLFLLFISGLWSNNGSNCKKQLPAASLLHFESVLDVGKSSCCFCRSEITSMFGEFWLVALKVPYVAWKRCFVFRNQESRHICLHPSVLSYVCLKQQHLPSKDAKYWHHYSSDDSFLIKIFHSVPSDNIVKRHHLRVHLNPSLHTFTAHIIVALCLYALVMSIPGSSHLYS